MRLLFCTTPLEGHFRPLLPLASSLAARGHEVAFATAASWRATVEAEGFEALAAGADHTAARGVRLDAGWDAIQELPALDRRPYVFSYLFAQGHAPLKLPALLDAARAWRAQALVYESGDLAAPVAAASLRLPSVNHGFGTMVSLSILERAAPAVAPLWRSAGLEPAPYAGAFEGLYVDVVPPLLADEQPLCPSIRLRLSDGEPVDPPPWLERLPRPLVYATMGTVFNRPESLAPLVEGLATAGVGALLTVGRNVDPSALGDVPPNVTVERFVPQAQVLGFCAAVVSHGGSGTVLGALAAGLPLVLLPRGADQFENAARCERAGAAIVLEPDEVTGDAVAAAVRLVLSEPAYALAARRIAAEFEEMETPAEAAAAVEEHVGAR
jgi:UDP:flavonoid glycosyltransferase YjiC (YdhE family)